MLSQDVSARPKSIEIAWLAVYISLTMKLGISPKLTDIGS
jgi:hypothetical protein